MSTNTISPCIHFPDSQISRDFVAGVLWPAGCRIQRKIDLRCLEETAALSYVLDDVGRRMFQLIATRMSSGSIHFILGPMTLRKEGESLETHLLHFLAAYQYHVAKEGRVVFPQFLFTPIISQIVGTMIKNGVSSENAHKRVLGMYARLFTRIKQEFKPDTVTGWFLEGYKESVGASWEEAVFQKFGWSVHFQSHCLEYYPSSEVRLPKIVEA
jgi:hypothetical protein